MARDRRTAGVNIRLRPEERAAWEAAALAEDLPISLWVRRTVRHALEAQSATG